MNKNLLQQTCIFTEFGCNAFQGCSVSCIFIEFLKSKYFLPKNWAFNAAADNGTILEL